ncbi:hypothetical protein M9434_006439 [Picochlorum sp. BPE23]|nr:hypothetical protein M9434_006439 [Picochlorum sp. BPE23]
MERVNKFSNLQQWCSLRPIVAAQGIKRTIKRSFSSKGSNHATSLGKESACRNFDYSAFKSCVWDLEQRFLPSRVESVVQYREQSLALKLRTVTDIKWLSISWKPDLAHIGTRELEPRRGSASEAFTFGDAVQRNLRGMILNGVSMPEMWERVAKLSFGERADDFPRYYLYVEIMNKHSNVVLCNEDNDILLAANQIGSKKSSQRLVQIKKKYSLPPSPTGLSPDDYTSFEDFKTSILSYASRSDNKRLDYCLSRCFMGVGPTMAREIATKAGLAQESDVASLDSSSWTRFHAEWAHWITSVVQNNFNCGYLNDKESLTVFHSQDGTKLDSSPLQFFGDYYSTYSERDEACRMLSMLRKTVKSQHLKVTKKLASLENQLDSSDAAEATKLLGDLVMCNLHKIKPGAAEVEVDNWETGNKEVIKLDPTISGVENAEALYKKASKLRRGSSKILPLIESCKGDMAYLEDTEVLLESLEGGTADEEIALLNQIESELVQQGFMKKKSIHVLKEKSQKKAKKASKSVSSDYRRLKSPNGFDILVGRSSQQNDEITMRLAKPGDIWMHARGFPGAHVLLRCSPSQSVENSDLEFAANLAAYYSKGANLAKVDVIMADKKDISKPKGAKPGQVLVKKERVIVATPASITTDE